MFKKNDVLEIEITDQGTTGEGIGKVSGYTLFVKDTVIGDVAKVKVMKAKKNYAFARLVEIVSLQNTVWSHYALWQKAAAGASFRQ